KSHNYRWANICTDFVVHEDYRYNGPGGRLSDLDTTLFEAGVPKEKWTQSYTYDAAGRITQVNYPSCLAGCSASGRSVSTTYAYGRTTSVPGFATAFTYNENGTLGQIQRANGVVFTEGIDPKGMARPASVSAVRGTTPVWEQESYAYDGAGNITQ